MPPESTNLSSITISREKALTPTEKETALETFRTILTYPTVSSTAASDGAYTACAAYLNTLLTSIPPLKVTTLPESPPNAPVVVAKWTGRDPSLPVLLLNSHYDVVPAPREDWTVPPFSGLQKDGFVYGRGAQDMKCVCVQYIAAMGALARSGFVPERTIYLTFVPDEEVGGAGMAAFLESEIFLKDMGGVRGVALALDEGLASEDNIYSVFYGERLPWWITVTATGPTGHGSRFIPDTAVEQLIALSSKALAFRKNQRDILFQNEPDHSACAHAVVAKVTKEAIAKTLGGGAVPNLGDVTTLNITSLEAGVKSGGEYVTNCVPPVAKANMDIRISPHVDPSEIESMINTWCNECAAVPGNADTPSSLTWDYIGTVNSSRKHATTPTDPKVNPWYARFQSGMEKAGVEFRPQVFPAATDSRFLRALGIRALGFSPMRNSEILLHENDERLNVNVFLEGVDVYVVLIEELASAGRDVDNLCQSGLS